MRALIPEYGPGWKSKVTLPSVVAGERLRIFSVVARSPDGVEHRVRVTPAAYLELVAATNFKQRTRKMVENLTDEMPPLYTAGVQMNTDPSTFDVLGRRYFLRANMRF